MYLSRAEGGGSFFFFLSFLFSALLSGGASGAVAGVIAGVAAGGFAVSCANATPQEITAANTSRLIESDPHSYSNRSRAPIRSSRGLSTPPAPENRGRWLYFEP